MQTPHEHTCPPGSEHYHAILTRTDPKTTEMTEDISPQFAFKTSVEAFIIGFYIGRMGDHVNYTSEIVKANTHHGDCRACKRSDRVA